MQLKRVLCYTLLSATGRMGGYRDDRSSMISQRIECTVTYSGSYGSVFAIKYMLHAAMVFLKYRLNKSTFLRQTVPLHMLVDL